MASRLDEIRTPAGIIPAGFYLLGGRMRHAHSEWATPYGGIGMFGRFAR